MTFKEFHDDDQEHVANELVLILKNRPSSSTYRLILECNLAITPTTDEQVLEEGGLTKQWNSAFDYRLDKRPANQGGDQLHVISRKGQQWAYRELGRSRSEPRKYQMRTTRPVRDMVSSIFGIPPEQVAEANVVGADEWTLLIEVVFA